MGVSAKSLRKAVFLDRDGTIIRYVPQMAHIRDLVIVPKASEAIRILNKEGFYVFIVTNQPVVSQGLLSKKNLEIIHKELICRLLKSGARIDAVYVCPHQYTDHCACRKPKVLMIRRAMKQFPIDMKRSFFVGDHARDVATGANAKLKTVLLKTGRPTKDVIDFKVTPDFVVRDLFAAAKLIQKISRK